MTSSGSTGLRVDIQALRAVAVLYVLLNHLWPDHLPGGYVGVDVFFVISGYLITSHLFREQERHGRIALAGFWARRARRLLPASLLVLLVSAVLAWSVIPAVARQDDLVHIGWAAMYVLNWALAGQSLDYFAQEAGQTLVVHYWSLSVEEQFYLLWPLVLIAVFALTRRLSARAGRIVLAGSLAAIAAVSFGYAVWAVGVRPESVYFETTARAWEFAVGGLIALVPTIAPLYKRRLLPVVWAGWVALAVSAFLLDGNSGVPGIAALLPVLATVVIIAIGETESRLSPQVVLGWRPVQWLGDVSYSAYLWHFPLIVIAPMLLGHWLHAYEKLLLLVITLLLAGLTKRYVEDPVRFGALSRIRPRAVLAGAVAAMVVVGGGLVGGVSFGRAADEAAAAELLVQAREAGSDCFGAQAVLSGSACPASHVLSDPAYLYASPDETLNEQDASLGSLSCENERRGEGVVRVCADPPTPSSPTAEVALIGDSHLMVWRDAVRASAQDLGMHVRTYFKPGCPPTLDLEVFAKKGADEIECREWKTPAIAGIAGEPSIDIVVTSAWADSYRRADGSKDDGSGYLETWQLWLDAGKTVIVLNDTPRLEGTIVDCILKDGVDAIDPCSRPRPETAGDTVLARAAAQMDDERFSFVDYTDVFCDDRCHAVVGGIPAYRDSHHVSVALTRSFGTTALRPELERGIVEDATQER